MKAADVMTTNVVTVDPDASVQKAARKIVHALSAITPMSAKGHKRTMQRASVTSAYPLRADAAPAGVFYYPKGWIRGWI